MRKNIFLSRMRMKPIYKRILFKLSGEGLMGEKDFGISSDVLKKLASQLAEIVALGVEVCLVVGGGNIFRGAKEAAQGMNRNAADQVGMLATVMNGLFLQDALQKAGVGAEVFSALEIPKVCHTFSYALAEKALCAKKVAIFVAGTGNPFFTTDTAAVLRASEMSCDALLKSTQVDGVYDDDPRKNPQAKRFDEVDYDTLISKRLMVMDMTAVALARENHLPIVVFEQAAQNALKKAVCGEGKFTLIK